MKVAELNIVSVLFHLFTCALTLSVLCVAAVQAILIALQTHQLRHKPIAIIKKLPPLETMEGLLFQLIMIGFILLSLVLVTSGYLFWNSLTTDILIKVVMVIFAWLIFAIILLGRHLFGWRGRMAINSILCGVVVILLAYIGSMWLV